MVPSLLNAIPTGPVSWSLISKLSTKVADDTSKPVDNVYSFISSPALPDTNILVPSLLNAIPLGAVSWPLTSKLSTKVADDTSKPVVKVYSFISSPSLPTTNILVPSLLKVRPLGVASWPLTSKLSTKLAAACAELTKVRLKIRNIENTFFKLLNIKLCIINK